MRWFKRILIWLCCVGMIVVVATGAFAYARNSPRCTISGNHEILHLSPDGSQLLTVKKPYYRERSASRMEGPLLIWNTRSGKPRELLASVRENSYALSSNGHKFAAYQGDESLVLLDWRNREQATIRLPADCGWATPIFSPFGKYCMLDRHLIDVAAKKVIKSFARIEGQPCFSADERWLLIREDYFELSFWDLTNTRLAKKVHTRGDELQCPPGNEIVAVWKTSFMWRHRSSFESVEVWNLATLEQRFEIKLPNSGSYPRFHMSRDLQLLALETVESKEKSHQRYVEWFDLGTGAKLGKVPVSTNGKWGFSRNGAFVFAENSVEDISGKKRDSITIHANLSVYHTASGIMRWSRPSACTQACLGGSTGVILHQQTHGTVEAVELSSGDNHAYSAEDFQVANESLTVTPDGETFAAVGYNLRHKDAFVRFPWLRKVLPKSLANESSGVLVCESATCSERLRIPNSGRFARQLSDNGDVLVTVDLLDRTSEDRVIQIWDIPPHGAWLSAAIAGLVATVLVLSVTNRRRLRSFAVRSPS